MQLFLFLHSFTNVSPWVVYHGVMNFCLPYKLSHHQLASRRHSNTETFCWISLESTQRPQSDWDICRSRGDSILRLGHKISSSQAARRKHTFSVDIHQKYFVYLCVYAQFQKTFADHNGERKKAKITGKHWSLSSLTYAKNSMITTF